MSGSSGLRLSVDPMASTPPFEQVKDQIIALVDDRTLTVGQRLPPVRTLATDLGLAANTVAKVYRELEAAGVVVTRGRAGTFVAPANSDRAAREAALAYVKAVRFLGWDRHQATALVDDLWDRATEARHSTTS